MKYLAVVSIFLSLIIPTTDCFATDLITNGSFSKLLSGWSSEEFTGGCRVTTATEGKNVIVKESLNKSPEMR